ncbi:MAG TPA: hypothetical protein VKB76_08435 [Ktedonobacterales bacterium]|nr:hypothetical protein [Ktedonobacterales bacterium]
MTKERVRTGIIGGVAGICPLLLVALLTALGMLAGTVATGAALLAFPAGILLAGILSGYLAGQARRRRAESKVVIGAWAGSIAALIFGVVLEGFYVVRYVAIPANLRAASTLSAHPIRVTFAIVLMSALALGIAMLTTYLTAKPLPPPRPTRQTTGRMPAMPPRMPMRQPPPARYQ